MRVLQIVPELETGGAELTTVDMATALIDAGHAAYVVSQGGRMVADLPATARHITLKAAAKNPLIMLANAVRLALICKRERIAIIHARSRAPAWSALLAAQLTGLPFVTTYHGAYKAKGRLKWLYNSVMARGDQVIANSQFTADQIAALFPFARDRLVVIPRGTDFARFAGDALPYDWSLPKGAQVLVQVARLTEWKGQRVAISALAGLPEHVHLVLAGDDQGREAYRASLAHLAERSEVAHRVHLVGHADAARALASADVAIVASQEPEAFGRAAVEAQAAGVPVVVTDLGAARETVLSPPDVADEDRTGWHVKPGDPMALGQTVRQALALEGEARNAHIDRGKLHVHGLFSRQAMCDATLAVYEKLAQKAR